MHKCRVCIKKWQEVKRKTQTRLEDNKICLFIFIVSNVIFWQTFDGTLLTFAIYNFNYKWLLMLYQIQHLVNMFAKALSMRYHQYIVMILIRVYINQVKHFANVIFLTAVFAANVSFWQTIQIGTSLFALVPLEVIIATCWHFICAIRWKVSTFCEMQSFKQFPLFLWTKLYS